jgi:hypothetical protein
VINAMHSLEEEEEEEETVSGACFKKKKKENKKNVNYKLAGAIVSVL